MKALIYHRLDYCDAQLAGAVNTPDETAATITKQRCARLVPKTRDFLKEKTENDPYMGNWEYELL